MSLIEAMSCGIPCVAFDCKYGPAEILTNRETGLLVEDGNVAELAKAMLWLIEHPEERLRMGLAARESAKRYSKDNIMHHWVELFDRLS
jgi:glycosyltransferase involved in cell wall biosynthesis